MSHRFFVVVPLVGVLLMAGVYSASAPSLKERLNSADRVVTGKVVLIKAEPTVGLPISEHSPNWHDVVIEIEETLKGEPRLALLVVRFPESIDVVWYDAPKFSLGQKGVWILHKDKSGVYTALKSPDFQPQKETDNIRKLIQQK